MQKTVSIVAVAAACLLCAAPAFAADQAAPEKSPQTQRCQDLIKQFKMQNVGHIERHTLQQAKRKIFYAEKMCQSNPKNGVKTATEALKDINVRPRD
ncbi:MAG TPA: hypothetical protein VKA19_13035 [Alphaproteobacteria bacterium]|nr:hypothetical protein [Alphaproteobacteria bacterium]